MSASRTRFTRRMRSALRRDAQRLLTPGPPTEPLLPAVGPRVPDDARVQQVLDLCMGVGEVLLASGEGAGEATDTMSRLAAACGLPAVDCDVTFTAVTLCCHRGMAAPPVTSMRLVRARALDLTRLAAVYRIVERVERGELSVRSAAEALREAVEAPHPYPRWIATFGSAGLAGSLALLLGAPAVGAVVAVAVTGLISYTGRTLTRWGLPSFFRQVVGALLATLATAAVFALEVLPEGTEPALVVAAGITVLLSGFAVVGTVQDAIGGYYVTSAGRAAEIALLSAGLLTGVVLGLKVALRAGVEMDVAAQLPGGAVPVWAALVLSALGSAFFALGGYAALTAVAVAALAGAAGRGTFLALDVAGFGPVAATGLAAVVVGAAAGLLRRMGRAPGGRVPPVVVTLAGITPLLPGLTAYRGFYQLAVEGVVEGLVAVTLALAIGLALAAGVALGEFLTRPGRSDSDPARDGDRQ